MTALDLLDRARAVAGSRWLPVVLVAILAALLAHSLNAGRMAESEARRLAEVDALHQAGIATAAQQDARGTRMALADELARSKALADEVAKLKKASPGVRPVSVTTGTTGAIPVTGGVLPGSSLRCVLFEGDKGEIRLASASFATRGGNTVFVGAAEAWRSEPSPALLFGGALAAETTIERPTLSPGWGFGAGVTFSREGWAAGPVVGIPPARLLGRSIEASAGIGIGSNSMWIAQLQAIVR